MEKGLFDILIDKQSGFIEIGHQYDAQSMISPIVFEANSISIAAHAPIALINTLFRPAIWEANSIRAYASSIENIMLFIAILLIIIFPKKEIDNKNIFLFSLSFATSYLIIIGLTTPILGAISRYRIIPLIFIAMSILQLIDIEKIKSLFSAKEKHIK